jgi:DNA-binding CsgD family transcriptional regulator
MVALSTADANKWIALLNRSSLEVGAETPQSQDDREDQRVRLRQRQRRLTEANVAELAARYGSGATVYELAAEFGCHRTTVAAQLKRLGIAMRLRTPTTDVIDSMVRLYASGLSHLEVGKQLGYSANTVRNHLRERQVKARDTHGRERHPTSEPAIRSSVVMLTDPNFAVED